MTDDRRTNGPQDEISQEVIFGLRMTPHTFLMYQSALKQFLVERKPVTSGRVQYILAIYHFIYEKTTLLKTYRFYTRFRQHSLLAHQILSDHHKSA